MTDSTHTIGFIGCGKRARQHVDGIKADSRCRVVALADTNREAAESFNTDFGFEANVYEDYRELLDKEQPDVIITCLWTALHLPVFKACVDAGVKAVLSEKPVAGTWAESQEMARLAESSGCLLTFCHQRRFCAGNMLARQLIADGVFGDIQRMDLYSPPHLLDCGTHTFDQALSFNNESPAKWVLGAIDLSKTISYFNQPAESMATGCVVFENDVRAYIQVGGPAKDLGGGVRVVGSKGFIAVEWDGQCREAVVYSDPTWEMPALPAEPEPPMIGVVRNALDCLESGEEPELSYRKAMRATEIIFALYESARRRARIELPLETADDPLTEMLSHSGGTR